MDRMYAEEQPHDDDPYPKYSWMESSMSCPNCGLDSCNGIDCYDKPEEYYYEEGEYTEEDLMEDITSHPVFEWRHPDDQTRLDDLPHIMPATIEQEFPSCCLACHHTDDCPEHDLPF